MRPLLCAVLLVLVAPLRAAEPDALEIARKALDDCRPRLDAQIDVGFERVAARCRGLAQALERSGVEQWLPPGWKETRNNLSAGSLAELRAPLPRGVPTRPGTTKPRTGKTNKESA